MRQLLLFIIRFRVFIVFVLYISISLGLMFRYNDYQYGVYFNSNGYLAGTIHSLVGNVKEYFGLKEINEELFHKNAALESQILFLEKRITQLTVGLDSASLPFSDTLNRDYKFIAAMVVNNSYSRLNNYITIDKGFAGGLREEMGVVDHNGVVGIVESVSEHFALVLPILNPKLRLSCKVAGSNYFGSLVWDGVSPEVAILQELPRHVDFQVGDTIVTSGFSTVFPEGLLVGTILEFKKAHDDNFYSLKVNLSADFTRLGLVKAVEYKYSKEKTELESKIE